MNGTRRMAILACVAVCTSGCALTGGSEEILPPMRDHEISLHVINQNFYDARLFARWRSGHRSSIGQITGFNEETFMFPWRYFDIQIEIVLLSVGTHLTPWMVIDKGDELELVIDPSLHRRIRSRRP